LRGSKPAWRCSCNETQRRAIARQHSKAGSLHALHALFHGHHGTVRVHTLEPQSTQAHCLHLVANAVGYWNTIYTQLALDDLSRVPADDERRGRVLVTIALVVKAVASSSGQRERLRCSRCRRLGVAQRRRPAVADIIGARAERAP
jgi:hypothetical protein